MCIYLGQCRGEVRAGLKEHSSNPAGCLKEISARKSVGPGGNFSTAGRTPVFATETDSEDTADSGTRGTRRQHLDSRQQPLDSVP